MMNVKTVKYDSLNFSVKSIHVTKSKKGVQSRSLEKTLAWVRKSSAERRKKYRNELIINDDSRNNHKEVSGNKADIDISVSLEKGKAILAFAEANMRNFEDTFPKENPNNNSNSLDPLSCTHRISKVRTSNMGFQEHEIISGTVNTSSLCESLHSKLKNKLDRGTTLTSKYNNNNDGKIDVKREDEEQKTSPIFKGKLENVFENVDSKVEDAIRFLSKIKIHETKSKTTPLTYATEIDSITNAEESNMENPIHTIELKYKERMEDLFTRKKYKSLANIKRKKDVKKHAKKELFDPEKLEGAKRAEANAAKWKEYIATAKADAIAKSIFKARPLPGGVWIPNDPYKLTKAALGKQISKEKESLAKDKLIEQQRNSFRFVSNESCFEKKIRAQDLDPIPIEESRSSNKRIYLTDRDGYYLEKLFILISKNTHIFKVNTEERIDDVPQNDQTFIDSVNQSEAKCIPYEEVEKNINSVHRQVEKLEMRLEHRRKYYMYLKSKLERKEDLHLEYIEKPEFKGSDDYSSLKSDFGTRLHSTTKDVLYKPVISDGLLYKRHEKWLEQIERKREEARAQKEEFLLKDITGQPKIGNTKQSWEKAKVAHAEVIRRISHDRKQRQIERETLEKRIHDKKLAEIQSIQAQAAKKKKSSNLANFNEEKRNKNIIRATQEEFVMKHPNEHTIKDCEQKDCEHVEILYDSKQCKKHENQESERNTHLNQPSPGRTKFKILKNDNQNFTTSVIRRNNESICHDVIKINEDTDSHNSDENYSATNIAEPSCIDHQLEENAFENMNDKDFKRMIKKLGINISGFRGQSHNRKSRIIPIKIKKANRIDAKIDYAKRINALNDAAFSIRTPERTNETHECNARSKIMKKKESLDNTSRQEVNIPREMRIIEQDLKGVSSIEGTSTNSYKYFAENSRVEEMMNTVEQKLIFHRTSSNKNSGQQNDLKPDIDIEDSHSRESLISSSIFCKDSKDIDEIDQNLEPYEKYETGQTPFFDRSSSVDKGRFRVRDAKGFAPGSMRRKPFSFSEIGEDTNFNHDEDQIGPENHLKVTPMNDGRKQDAGIMLLVGKKEADAECFEEMVITIMFDKSKFTEASARNWWRKYRIYFIK